MEINMGWNDRLELENFSYVATCPKCGKRFKVYEYEQIPGFRDTERLICPYCNTTVYESMEYEYGTEKMED